MNRELALAALQGGLWHTTHPDRFKLILSEGAILPDPPQIPESERHGTAIGPEGHPYVRSLGAVSLFDFANFDPEDYEQRYRETSWAYFVPHHLEWRCAVWIEIDRQRVIRELISGADLLKRWNEDKTYRRFMAEIEAAHVGPLPVSAFKQAFFLTHKDDEFHPLSILKTP